MGFRSVPGGRYFNWQFAIADDGQHAPSPGAIDLQPHHEVIWRPDGAPPVTYRYRAKSVTT